MSINQTLELKTMEDIYRSKLVEQISDILGEPIDLSYDEWDEYTDTENMNILLEAGYLESLYAFNHKLVIYPKDIEQTSENEIARIEWIISAGSGYVYMHWIEVSDEFQNQGIGSTLRQTVLDELRSDPRLSHAISEAHSKEGKGLITSQDFKPIEEFRLLPKIDDDGRWFAKSL